jgi:predicted ATPase
MEERFSQQAMPAAFLSDGTIDVIALIVILYFERKSLVIIEEPEKNLHPSLMSGLVAFLKDASRKKQIAITTHNPELVRFVEHSELILISRDPDGFSGAQRPADKEQVQRFLREELTMQELFVENLLEV